MIHLIQQIKDSSLFQKHDEPCPNKLANVPRCFNDLKKIDDLDVDKLKTVPVDLEKIK